MTLSNYLEQRLYLIRGGVWVGVVEVLLPVNEWLLPALETRGNMC